MTSPTRISSGSVVRSAHFAAPLAGAQKSRELALYGLGALFIGLLALWLWSRSAEMRAVRELPASDRRALYERTLQTLQSAPCNSRPRADELREFCRQQAEFIVQFQECDQTCSLAAKRYLINPAR